MSNTVVIDCFPESAARYRDGHAIIAVDVVRATTTAITAVASGRRCFPVATLEDALQLAGRLESALLAGEQGGTKPSGFDLDNSPTELLARSDVERAVLLLSSSGTKLCHEASKGQAAFVACLRNYIPAAAYVAGRFANVAVIGAGSRGEFREEDQMCCAWIAQCLMDLGYAPAHRATLDLVRRWRNQPVSAWVGNKSSAYLRKSGRLADLEFILGHVGDLNAPFILENGEVTMGAALPASEGILGRGIYGA